MATEKVILEISAQTADAQKKLSRFGTQATKTMQGIQNSLSGVKVLAAGVAGFFAGRALINNLKDITQAAAIQEDAINALNTSLKTSGEFSEQASQDMQRYASELQNASVFGDELILNQLALAKAFGATNEQAKDVVTAAAELAAATGKSLDEATRQVSKTLGGFAGELGEVNPAIKALTAEQLKAGEAAKILIEQYSGSAISKISTYSGSLTQLSNVFGDLKEEIGFAITRNPVLIEGIRLLTKFFGKLIDIVKENQDGISSLISGGFKGLINLIPSMITFFQTMLVGWQSVQDAVDLALRTIANFGVQFGRIAQIATYNPLTAIQEAFTGEKLPNAARDFTEEMKLLFDTIVTEGQKPNESIEKLFILLEKSKTEADKLAASINAIPDKAVNIKTEQTSGSSGSDNAIVGFATDAGTYIAEAFTKAIEGMSVGQMMATSFSAMLSGKEGAKKAIGAAVDAVLPGFGAVAQQIMSLGPDGVKQMIKDFMTALPDMVVGLVDGLVAGADAIIIGLVDSLITNGGMERIISALVTASPRIAVAIAAAIITAITGSRPQPVRIDSISLNAFTHLFETFLPKLGETLGGIKWDITSGIGVSIEDFRIMINSWQIKFFNQMTTIFNGFFSRMTNIFNELLDGLKANLPGGGGSSYNVVNQLFGSGTSESIFGGSKGGVVPLYAANGAFVPRGTDTVPAMLTPGERVLTVQQNQSFEQLPMILAQLVSVLSSPMTTETSIEIDGNRLADVILQLNRRNARVA